MRFCRAAPTICSRRLAEVTTRLAVCGLILLGCRLASAEPASGGWQLADGDRIVLLGEGFIEREGQLGVIESALVAAHPELSLEFRNIGWNGDTVWAESRGVFDSPAKGYERMLALVRELKPTVILVAYGRNESYAGLAGLAAFREQLTKLVADLATPAEALDEAAATDRAAAKDLPVPRVVLITPHPFLPADTCPDAADRNRSLAAYVEVIREVAGVQGDGLIDLFARFPQPKNTTVWSEDGFRLTPAGYEAAATIVVESAGRSLPPDSLATLSAVRQAVVAKNELFFHRWRPANETYLFLFRRHEQGNNAIEIPQFDPLVEAAEEKVRVIARTIP
jgi:lysophospholipase L1-like esterase